MPSPFLKDAVGGGAISNKELLGMSHESGSPKTKNVAANYHTMDPRGNSELMA